MSGIQIVTSTLFALAVAASDAVAAGAYAADGKLRAELERISQRRVFFGHQSVGENLLDGVKSLANVAGVPVRIALVTSASGVGPAMLGHTFVAENRNPLGKFRAFDQAMAPQPAAVDIAMVKLCYLDFTPETDAKALFGRYRATLDGLRARNPGTTFVHVTAPLTEIESGPKALLKRLLGRAPYGIVENVRREEYNALLRQTYRGREPVFDLARIESTAPDGKAMSVEWKGSVAPVMAAAYTDDGGHLNAAGRLRAARELISILAAIPERSAR